ncbi:uncharacterized protein At2g39795, mitochondrial [Eucalyptus grandis]|uniref:uncharacterized protein At2g39795, mitochondrial n=1 Tax=Eucalyptus grandis TaxID=71139 RepID=UPI00192EFBD1|nr:uncharacterized protein At2g39795, mitochondrial [Eucalyptus grandis]XP_010048146.2 uncharacterized protein At2g39795, mitochondrial [Eucalyptus grandis]
MASPCSRLARSVRRPLLRPETLASLLSRQRRPPFPPQDAALALLPRGRRYSAESVVMSPFDAHILRILDSRIELESEYPVPEPPTKFDSFTVQDQPGQRWVTLRGNFGNGEDIKIEATSFDAAVLVQKPGEDNSRQDMRLHISLLVDVSKGDGLGMLEFLCSAWPDSLEIRNVYLFRKEMQEKMHSWPYMGPDSRKLNAKIGNTFREFLETRGVNNKMSAFLHEYMKNKERVEHLRWLKNVKSLIQK